MQFFSLDRQVFIQLHLSSSIFIKNDNNYKVAPELAVSEIILSELQIKAFVFSNLIPKDPIYALAFFFFFFFFFLSLYLSS